MTMHPPHMAFKGSLHLVTPPIPPPHPPPLVYKSLSQLTLL